MTDKAAGSKLREAVKFVSKPNQLSMVLGGQTIGHIGFMPGAAGPQIASSVINPEFRGMGLGKKLYGQAMAMSPTRELSSDSRAVSQDAQRIWESMQRRYGTVSVSPTAVRDPFGVMFGHGQPVYRGSLPPQARPAPVYASHSQIPRPPQEYIPFERRTQSLWDALRQEFRKLWRR